MATAPDTTSSDYVAMLPYWNMVDAILEGADAMRKAGEAYLPKFPNETIVDYDYRLDNAKFSNIFSDIVSSLAAKPFAEPVALKEGTADERFTALADDIDGRGNNLHVFASEVFYAGIASAIDWILVDFAKAKPGATLADERKSGVRPYWVRIPAKSMIAVYSAVIDGREQFTHVRFEQTTKARSGFDEVCVSRIRVFDRAPLFDEAGNITGYAAPTFQVWEQRTTGRWKGTWTVVDEGPMTIDEIPVRPFATGRRKGGSWTFTPPLQDAAHLQVEHYQQETGLKSIKELTAFPMLAGNGVQPQMKGDVVVPVPVGPKTTLYAPPSGEDGQHGEWAFVEPSATSLEFLAKDVERTEKQLRELGRQPLIASQMTVVQAGMNAQKANSAIQAWALGLKDTLEACFWLTAKWLKSDLKPVVQVFTDFALEMGDDKGPDFLLTMREKGDLSRSTLWSEAKRRNILSGDFDPKAEEKAIADELPDEDSEEDALGALPPADPANAA